MKFTELATEEQVRSLIQYHNENSKHITLDTETTGLDRFNDKITDVVVTGYTEDEACIFPGELVQTLSALRIGISGQNLKFDFLMCYQAGVDLRVQGMYRDSMLLDHLRNENDEHSLDAIVKRLYNDPYKEEFWSTYKTFQEAPKDAQLAYACKDVIYTRRAIKDITTELVQRGTPEEFIEHVHKFARAIFNTELEGLNLDLPYLSQMGNELTQKISTLKKELREHVGLECDIIENKLYLDELDKRKTDKGKANVKKPEFNFDSSRQLGYLLYDQLKLPVQTNKKGNRTVDDAALEKLSSRSDFIPKLREYRGHQKVYTAFIEGSLEKSRDGRIYPTFNVNGTVTGRPSSSNPNLQQLPAKGGVRGIYVPKPGYVFISSDYASLEVVLAAHFSQDKNLLRVVNDGVSLHDITAEGLGIPRAQAKTINFGVQYGAGAHKIAQVLGVSNEEGEKVFQKYWETYSGLYAFMKSCWALVDQGKPVINPFGRRRHFPTKFDNFWEKQRAYRQASNSLIQGTGSDCTLRSFYLIDAELKKKGFGCAKLIIHDEVLVEVKESSCQDVSDLLSSIMEGVGREINLTVPLNASVSKPMHRWEKG